MTKKEFYNYLVPEHRQDSFYKKVYFKLFSLAVNSVNGDYQCETGKDTYNVDSLKIVGNLNGCQVIYEFPKLLENSYYKKIPTKIGPKKVIFRSGYQWIPSWRYEYNWLKDNEKYLNVYFDNIFDVIKEFPNTSGLFRNYNSALKHAIDSNPEKIVKLDERFLYLCLEDFFGNIKKGDVFDSSESYHIIWSFYDVYKNRYPDFQKYTVNLNGEVPTPTNRERCTRAKFGCPNGCINSCLAESVNKKNNRLYMLFKDWQKHLK
jgi:hypothetical protein